jgi:hypothetical protein
VLDRFLFSGALCNTSIDGASASDTDNLSNHEPVALRLRLNRFLGFRDRFFMPRVLWAKATDNNIGDCQNILSS